MHTAAPPLSLALPLLAVTFRGGTAMSLIALVVLVLILLAVLPTWPYSGGWGYYPSGGVGLVLLIVLVLVLTGRL
jgi:hypothetical protein